ncbi:MAG: MBL fold metallo-hydrolase [bacterium]
MKLIPLGTNGYHPSFARQTASYLALFDNAAFLLDAGTGVARMREPAVQEAMRGYDELNVILSHYHVDHIVGLYFLNHWPGGAKVIHAPTCPFIAADPREAIERLFKPPLNSFSMAGNDMRIVPINAERMRIGGYDVSFWPQQHPGGSVGVRIGDEIAYLTDTVVMPENAGKVRGVQCLLHELWLTDEEAAADEDERNRHSTFGPLASFLKACAPKTAMTVHLSPTRTDEEAKQMATDLSNACGLVVRVPNEGSLYEL